MVDADKDQTRIVNEQTLSPETETPQRGPITIKDGCLTYWYMIKKEAKKRKCLVALVADEMMEDFLRKVGKL